MTSIKSHTQATNKGLVANTSRELSSTICFPLLVEHHADFLCKENNK